MAEKEIIFEADIDVNKAVAAQKELIEQIEKENQNSYS